MEINNFEGKRFGMLVVKRKIRLPESKCFKWECECDCGNVSYVHTSCLKQGQISCGCKKSGPDIDLTGIIIGNARVECYKNTGTWDCVCLLCGNHFEKKTGDINRAIKKGTISSCGCVKERKNIIDLRGKTFGLLTVLDEPPIKMNKGKKPYWNCQCVCGNKKIIKGAHLVSGGVKSCGCLLYERKLNEYNLSGEFGTGYTSKKEEFYFDLEDYEKIKMWTWWKSDTGHIVSKTEKDKTILIHRIILQNNDVSMDIDHIDRNPSNNKKENLRICTKSDNQHNKNYLRNKVIGVNRNKNGKRWTAEIFRNWKKISLGTYSNYEDAVIARLKKELELFGRDFSPQRSLFERYGI